MTAALRAALLCAAALLATPAHAQFSSSDGWGSSQRQAAPRAQNRQTPRRPSQPWWMLEDDDDDDDVLPQARSTPPRSSPVARGPAVMDGGGRPHISASTPPIVSFRGGQAPGTIVIDTSARSLYYVLPGGRAYRYPIAVGRIGFSWTGTQRVSRVASWPDWHPPAEMRKRQPGLPVKMTGGVRNPLGAKAIYLGSTLYRIHGTNDARSIGTASSSGCFRMTNSHVMHLAGMVRVGTTVQVHKGFPGGNRRNIATASGAGRS